MATITSAQDGNWSATTTWVGGVVPGDGDTITISHNIVVDTTAAYGTGGGTGTYELTINGSLSLAAGATLSAKGDMQFNTSSSLSMSPGSNIDFPSGNYKIKSENGVSFDLSGSALNRCSITATNSNYFWIDTGYGRTLTIDANYCDFDGMGNSGTYSIRFGGSTAQNSVFTNCIFNNNGRMAYATYDTPHADSVLKFINCDFKNFAHSQAFYALGRTVNFAENSHVFIGCSFDGPSGGGAIYIQTGGSSPWVISENVFSRTAVWISVKNTTHSNVSYSDIASFEQYEYRGSDDGSVVYDNVYLTDDNNGHFFSVTGTGQIQFNDNFSESNAITADTTNHYLPTEGAYDTDVIINRALCLGGNAIVVRDNAAGLSRSASVVVSNLTHAHIDGTADALAYYEGYSFSGDFSLKNSLEYSLDADAQLLIKGEGTVASSDYNSIYNKTYADRYDSGITVTSGASNDVDYSPEFRDATTTSSAWDLSIGGTGSMTNAVAGMLKLNDLDFDPNYTVDNLLTFVRSGFTPTNMDLLTAGESGTHIGAVVPVSAGISTEQTITVSTGDVIRITSSVTVPNVGNLYLKIDGENLDLTDETTELDHTVTSDNPTLTLTITDDCDGAFVDVSIQKVMDGYVPHGATGTLTAHTNTKEALENVAVLNAPQDASWIAADANLPDIWFDASGDPNDVSVEDLTEIDTQQYVEDEALLLYGDDISGDCQEETNNYLGKS